MKSHALAAALGCALLGAGCASANNYLDPLGPRFAEPVPAPTSEASADSILQVVTFNIENGEQIETALEVIQGNDDLRLADIVLLQEVDAQGASRVAEALAMGWVYYPARERGGRGFGNAVLSRWPIEEDAKLILPHLSRFGDSQRTATMALVRVDDTPIRVYSAHLATLVNQSAEDRQDQLRAILEDAADASLVVIGGDMNSGSLPELALEAGYEWPTRSGPNTIPLLRVDHILFRGFQRLLGRLDTGTVMDNLDSSDHRPVWARVRIPAEEGRGSQPPSASLRSFSASSTKPESFPRTARLWIRPSLSSKR